VFSSYPAASSTWSSNRHLYLLTLTILAGLLVACGGDNGNSVAPTATAESAASSPGIEKPTVQVTATIPSAAGPTANEPVSLAAADGAILRGYLYSAPGPKRRVVLIVSGSLDQTNWQKHVAEFIGKGVAVMTFDARGRGETGGSINDAQMDKDVELAVRYLRSREYPLIYVLGIGAPTSAAVIKTASTQDLAGIAVLPASGASEDIAKVTEKKLLMAFDSDSELVSGMNRLAGVAPEPMTRVVFPPPPAPVQDVLSVSAVKQAVLDFVSQ
jgi:alpha/beta superfamily hydrolase